MTLHFFRSLVVCIVAAAMFALSPGCKSSPDAKATVNSMSTFGVEIATVKDSIDGTVKALEAVVGTQPSDLKANFDAYAKSVIPGAAPGRRGGGAGRGARGPPAA